MKIPFIILEQPKRYSLLSCQKVCDILDYLLYNIFTRFGSKLYSRIVDSQMGTTCAALHLLQICFDLL